MPKGLQRLNPSEFREQASKEYKQSGHTEHWVGEYIKEASNSTKKCKYINLTYIQNDIKWSWGSEN